MKPRTRVERRSEPRYRYFLPVRIGDLKATTANISLQGVQIICPRIPFDRDQAHVQGRQLHAQLFLPQGAPIDATLSVHYSLPYGDEFLIGVKMTLADPGAQARWAAHIDTLSISLWLRPGDAAET